MAANAESTPDLDFHLQKTALSRIICKSGLPFKVTKRKLFLSSFASSQSKAILLLLIGTKVFRNTLCILLIHRTKCSTRFGTPAFQFYVVYRTFNCCIWLMHCKQAEFSYRRNTPERVKHVLRSQFRKPLLLMSQLAYVSTRVHHPGDQRLFRRLVLLTVCAVCGLNPCMGIVRVCSSRE